MNLSTSTNICCLTPEGIYVSTKDCIKQCAAAGYSVLDINFCEAMNPDSRLRDDDWESYVEELAALGESLGVTFTQSHLPYYDIFGKNEPEKVSLMEELIRRTIIASARLGVRWAVTHPGTVWSAASDMSVSLERNVEYYEKHLRTAREYGIGIALENDFEYRGNSPCQRVFCAYAPEQAALIDAFNDPEHVGACYDFGHGNLTGGFHRENLLTLGHRLKAVHIADNRGMADEHQLPFLGNIDWKLCMETLAEIHYEGDLTYEIQQYARYYPQEAKPLAIHHALEVQHILAEWFTNAKR